MKISWNGIKDVAFKAFNNYTDGASFTAVSKYIYDYYRASASRSALSGSQQGLIDKHLSPDWEKAVGEVQGNTNQQLGQVLQIRDTNNSLAYSAPGARRAVGQGEVAECVLHNKANGGPQMGRLQIVVKPEATGAWLNKQLYAIMAGSACVSQWKIMNPSLGSSGPDSAVVYLACPIDDAQVNNLIGNILATDVRKFLDDGCRAPLGLTVFAAGIFGCDLPTENIQRNTLGMSHTGSAGDIIARVISRGTQKAAIALCSNDETSKKNAAAIELEAQSVGNEKAVDNFIRAAVKSAVEEIGWTLEN